MKHFYFCLLMALLLSACSKPTIESQLQSARKHSNAGEYQEAVIDYRNVLLQQPNNQVLRLELGQLYLKSGQFEAAEKEFQKALELGSVISTVAGPLSAAIYYQNDYIRLVNFVEELNKTEQDISQQAVFFNYIASLKSQLDDRSSVAIPTEQLSQDYLLMAQTFEALSNANPKAALTLSSQFTQPDVEPFEKALFIATTHSMLGDSEQTILAYENALAVYTTYYPLRFLLAEALISERRIDEASAQIKVLTDINPNSAYANYLLSIILFYKEQPKEALYAANTAIQGNINAPRLFYIAGVSAYKTGKFEEAYRHLVTATAGLPANHIAHKLLARTRIELGYIDELADSIDELNIDSNASAQLYALAAVKSYKINDNKKAEEYLQKSLSIQPDNTASLLSKGLIEYEKGDENSINTLNQVIGLDPSLGEAWTLKALAEAEQNGLEAAIAVTKEFQKTQELAGLMLEGLIYLKASKEQEAKQAFEKAYKLAPDNDQIGYYVMIANARSNNAQGALKIAEKLLESSPNNLNVTVDYVNLLIKVSEDPLIFLDQRIAEHPELAAPVAAKAYVLMLDHDYEQAISLLKNSTTPPHSSTYMALGKALFDTRKFDEAAATYKNWTQSFPSDWRAWYRYIITLQGRKKISQGLAAAQDALVYFPQNEELSLLKANFLVSLGENDKAATVLKSIENKGTNFPEFNQISGTIAYNQGDYEKALTLLQTAYQQKPSFSTAEVLAYGYAKLDQPEKGLDVLKSEIEKGRDQFYGRFLTAQYAANQGLVNESIEQYKILNESNPNNFSIMNNLANMLVRANDIEQANELATRVMQMQPQSPYAISTFGLVKMKQGDLESARRYFEKALLKFPGDTETLLQLCETFLEMNDRLEAQTLLGKISPRTEFERDTYKRLSERLKK